MNVVGGQHTILPQVLGASTVAGSVALLPDAGDNWIKNILSFLSILLGSVCLLSFLITRLLKKFWA